MQVNNLSVKQSLFLSLQRVMQAWLTTDAPVLIYMAKATLAALLAMVVSMTLTLPDPRTAIFTSFIVMQPQSGLVFSKSYYRVLGTLAGVIVSVAMIGAFAQDPVWFILFFAIWIGLTTAAGVKYRNFQSYGFVLAGYTLCIVALPVIERPMDIFEIATSRFSEVMVGIICATIISDVIFPRKLSDSLWSNERERFDSILATLANQNSLFGTNVQSDSDVANFSSGVVGLNAIRANSAFESGADKRNRDYYEKLNQEFMYLSTTFHSLKNIIVDMQSQHYDASLATLQELYGSLTFALNTIAKVSVKESDVLEIVQRLKNAIEVSNKQLQQEEERLRALLQSEEYDAFLAAAYLITRLLDELKTHCHTFALLLKLKNSGEVSKELNRVVRFKTHTDNVLVLLAAFRGAGVLLFTMMFWILSSWQYATITITMAVVIGLLIGTLPRPLDAVMNFLKGAVSAAAVAALYDFYIVPEFTTDVYTLGIVVAPVLAFVGWMTTKPKWSGFSLGFVFLFMSQTSFDLYYKISPTVFLETTVASLLGVIFAGVAYMLVNFWSCSLTQNRVAKVLRQQIVSLCSESTKLQRASLQSMGRDMLQQFSTHGRLNVRSSRLVYEWLLFTLEIGGAIMRVKKMMKRLKIDEQSEPLGELLNLIREYFEKPTESLHVRVLGELKDAIERLHVGEGRTLHSILVEFATIRTMMLRTSAIPIVLEDGCR